MTQIIIKNLRLRTIIGINDWEREKKQDIVINVSLNYNAASAIDSDSIEDALDYKTLTKKIISKVEASQYFLLEKLADEIINIIFEEELVSQSTVRIDKPHALRFADSVSFELTRTNNE